MWKEALEVYIKVLLKLNGGTEEKHQKQNSEYLSSKPKFVARNVVTVPCFSLKNRQQVKLLTKAQKM
jgi:hypothetical protein